MEDQIRAARSGQLGTVCRPCILPPIYLLIGFSHFGTEQWPVNMSVKTV